MGRRGRGAGLHDLQRPSTPAAVYLSVHPGGAWLFSSKPPTLLINPRNAQPSLASRPSLEITMNLLGQQRNPRGESTTPMQLVRYHGQAPNKDGRWTFPSGFGAGAFGQVWFSIRLTAHKHCAQTTPRFLIQCILGCEAVSLNP